MRISSRTGYALSVLAELDSADHEAPVRTEDLAVRASVPRAYLELILAALRRARLLRAVRGPGGGWKLARPAQRISARDVFEALEGKLLIIEPGARARKTERLWSLLARSVEKTLAGVSVRSLNAPVRKAPRRAKASKPLRKTGRLIVKRPKTRSGKARRAA